MRMELTGEHLQAFLPSGANAPGQRALRNHAERASCIGRYLT